MRYKKQKKKKRIGRNIRKVAILVIFLYFIIKSVPVVLARNDKTILPEKDILLKSYDAQGVIIKEEQVFTTVGGITPEAQDMEGKRVPAGFKVANISISNDISGLKEELKEIERSIDMLNKSNAGAGLFEKIKKDNGETLIDQSVEALNARKDAIIQEISSNKVLYTTSTAGLLSFNLDGYEKIYIPKEFENYTYENLEIPNTTKSDKEKKDGFKLINNFEWYIAIKIDNAREIKEYEEGDLVNLEIVDGEDEIAGRIVKINKTGNRMVLVVKFNNQLEKYYNLRFPEIKMILSKDKGFKIPTKTIIDKDGQKGVYVKEFSGIIKFRHISIMEEVGDYTFVRMGNNGYIQIAGYEKPVRTITFYDEILLDPSNIKEGQIID